MSELDDSKSGGPAEDSAPEGYEDTVVEILSLGDEADAADAGRAGDPPAQNPDLRRLESQLSAERERMLRLRADFDNYRKRTERERAEIERYALADMLRELLPVVDNLERDTIEDTIDNLFIQDMFESVFTLVTEDETTTRTTTTGKRATTEVAAVVISDVLVVEG